MAEDIQKKIIEEMVAANIISHDGSTSSYFKDGREYLILLSAVDITDWEREVDPEDG